VLRCSAPFKFSSLNARWLCSGARPLLLWAVMGQDLLNRVRVAIEKQGLLRAGERLGVAVSGGADSVGMLLLLLELRKQLGVVLSVVHFNHKLRGKHSDADEKFAAKLAAEHKLAFYAGRGDVAADAKHNKANLEDTAREARYQFFAVLVAAGHLDKVVVAHTADDQAETVLAHILRGTGIAGLGGIHPRVGNIVRPLLGVHRAELRAYLKSKKQTWREDATNRDTTRMRARIRKKLLPILEKQFQPAVVEHLATLAELAREDEAFLDALVNDRIVACVERGAGRATISIRDLLARIRDFTAERTPFEARGKEIAEKNFAVSGRIVRTIVGKLKPREGQLNAAHVQAILDLARRGRNGKCLDLPGGVQVRREHDSLVFCVGRSLAESKESRAVKYERKVDLDGVITNIPVLELSCVFRFRVIDWPAKRRDTIEAGYVLDREALQWPLVLRNWQAGDRFRPWGHRSEHKLKRLLSKKRVSGREREGWPVVISRGTLVWVRGFPVAAELAANEKTRFGVVITEEPIS
jgi:tRNA(Ile)-lysidine synthase